MNYFPSRKKEEEERKKTVSKEKKNSPTNFTYMAIKDLNLSYMI